jgi:hypothetical protein
MLIYLSECLFGIERFSTKFAGENDVDVVGCAGRTRGGGTVEAWLHGYSVGGVMAARVVRSSVSGRMTRQHHVAGCDPGHGGWILMPLRWNSRQRIAQAHEVTNRWLSRLWWWPHGRR